MADCDGVAACLAIIAVSEDLSVLDPPSVASNDLVGIRWTKVMDDGLSLGVFGWLEQIA